MIYLSYHKSLNICKTLQNYSQDINYYKTVKKVHKKVIKIFHYFTTFTLPLYGNQMNRTSLSSKSCFEFSFALYIQIYAVVWTDSDFCETFDLVD